MAITSSDVRNVVFQHSSLFRRGYEMGEVDDFLDEIVLALDKLVEAQVNSVRPLQNPPESAMQDQAQAALTARVHELELELVSRDRHAGTDAVSLQRQLGESVRETERLREESRKDLLGISTRAVDLLSAAQASADRTISEADEYARELVNNAREQFQEILGRAQHLSRSKIDPTPIGEKIGRSVPEIEYVRTCAQVAQAQLQSLLTTLPPEVMSQPRTSGIA